jgi:hypothetical protein
VDQSDLDLLAAGHDRSADGDPPGDDERFGQARRLCGAGPGRREAGAGPRAGTGQARVRARTPPARTWATGPSNRSVTRCPASGRPALTMRSPRLTLPDAFTVRSTSITSPDAGGSEGGPAGCAPAAVRRARSRASSRDGRVFDAVAAGQDLDPGEPGPEPDGAAGHRGPEPDLLPGDKGTLATALIGLLRAGRSQPDPPTGVRAIAPYQIRRSVCAERRAPRC